MIPKQPTAVEQEIVDFFGNRNFERSRRFGTGSYDPQNLKEFLVKLGNPQFFYETIHVAGTVGKGSAATYLMRALTALGFKTGGYFSPHFISLCERFCIDGNLIAANELSRCWLALQSRVDFAALSFFDAMTALGFSYFHDSNCEWAVIETGLGGRLDSTNNLKAKIAVITRIGLDHQEILGSTIAQIAQEKAGIIHTGQVVYTPSTQDAEALAVIANTCVELDARLHIVAVAGGDFQDENRSFVRGIMQDFFKLSVQKMTIVENTLRTSIFGRWSEISSSPKIIFDSAHNSLGLMALARCINQQSESSCTIFLNTMRERDLSGFCKLLKKEITKPARLIFLTMNSSNYYDTLPEGIAIEAKSDNAIKEILADTRSLHIFTGSMGIYAELRARFGL